MPSGESQWNQIIELYYRDIFAYCYRILGNRAEAEDVTQETFARAFAALPDPQDSSTVRAFLYAVARNCWIDRKRWWKRWTRLLTSQDAQPQSQENPVDSLSLEVLQQLPAGQREVFVLRYLQDLSTSETASLLGISEGTVKSQLKRAVDTVKKSLLEKD